MNHKELLSKNNKYFKYITSLINSGDQILFVVPPITLLESPNLGLHILQSFAKKNGIKARILYADILFALMIGLDEALTIADSLMSPYEQIGERLFCAAAFNFPHMGHRVNDHGIQYYSPRSDEVSKNADWSLLKKISRAAIDWADFVAKLLAQNIRLLVLALLINRQLLA